MNTETRLSLSAQVASTFDFSVDKFPLSGPDGMRTPFYGLFRSDTCEVVHDKSVSADYEPHTTDDVVALVEATESVFGDCKPRCHFSKGHYVDLMPSHSQRLSVYGNADNIWPRLQISAGYNGSSFHFCLGWFRDLCRNMSMFRSVRSTSFSYRHNGNLRDNLDNLVDQLTGLREGWNDLSETIIRMEASRTSLSDFMTKIYGDGRELVGSKLTRHENRTKAIVRRVLNERDRSGRPALSADNDDISGWEAYNMIQGYVQHEQSRRGDVTAFDRELKSATSTEVGKAERMALALCV